MKQSASELIWGLLVYTGFISGAQGAGRISAVDTPVCSCRDSLNTSSSVNIPTSEAVVEHNQFKVVTFVWSNFNLFQGFCSALPFLFLSTSPWVAVGTAVCLGTWFYRSFQLRFGYWVLPSFPIQKEEEKTEILRVTAAISLQSLEPVRAHLWGIRQQSAPDHSQYLRSVQVQVNWLIFCLCD